MALISSSVGKVNAQCGSTQSDEFFVILEGDYEIDIKLTNLDVSPTTSITYEGISVSSPHSSGRSNCQWIASTDNSDTGGTVEWMDPQVLYKFEIIWEGSPALVLYFYECSSLDEDDDPFLCPATNTTGTLYNDLNIYFDTDSGSFDFRPHGLLNESLYDSVNDTFSDPNWMWPLDLGTFCYLNGQKNGTCGNINPDYFLSPQQPASTMTHTAADLLIFDYGVNSGQIITISGEGQNLIFTTGTSLVVEENAELTLGPDLKLSFPSSQGIDVDGKIIIAGTSSGPVILDKSGISEWGGLYISGSGANSSSIDYLELKNAVTGLFLLNVDDIEIDNSKFELNSTGVMGSNSSSVTINNSSSFDNSLFGVRNHLGHTTLFNSDIFDNGEAGVRITGTADLMSVSDGPGLNRIYGNGEYGIYLSGGSIEMGNDSSGDGGDNSIYSNTDFDAMVVFGGSLKGENNWWGENPPSSSEMYVDGSSSLDYTPYLTGAPSKGNFAPTAASTDESILSVILGARGTFMSEVRNLRKSGQREASSVFLKEAVNDKTNNYRDLAAPLYIADMFRGGDGWETSRIGEQFLTDNDLSIEAKVEVSRMLFEVYTHLEPSLLDAERMINVLKVNGYDQDLLDIVTRSYKRSVDSLKTDTDNVPRLGKGGGIQKSHGYLTSPEMSVYPNPANSIATFRINSPRASHASVELFDILGRRVAIVFEGNILAGIQTMTFDSSNLPSGSYYYKAIWGQQTQAGILFLTK